MTSGSATYQQLALGLNSLLASLGEQLSLEEREEVSHFIEVGEYGLAFETLCDIIKEGGKPLSSNTYNSIVQLGHQMLLDRTAWEGLRSHIRNENA